MYAIILDAFAKNFLILGAPKVVDDTKITMLGYDGDVDWEVLTTGELMVSIPRKQDLPDESAWGVVLRMKHLKNAEGVVDPLREVTRPPLPLKKDILKEWRRVNAVLTA